MLCLSLHIAPCNAAICSLLVAWSSNCCIAGSSTHAVDGSFIQKLALKEAAPKLVVFHFLFNSCGPLLRSPKNSADLISTELTYMYSVVRHHYSNSFTVSCYSLNWFDTTELRSLNLYAKPYKTHVLCTWVL